MSVHTFGSILAAGKSVEGKVRRVMGPGQKIKEGRGKMQSRRKANASAELPSVLQVVSGGWTKYLYTR